MTDHLISFCNKIKFPLIVFVCKRAKRVTKKKFYVLVTVQVACQIFRKTSESHRYIRPTE